MSDEENRHVIAASNFFLGTANFLVIELPPGWDLRTGARPPEVDRTHREGGVAWVAEGTSSHLLINEERRLGLLLEVTARPGSGARRRGSLSSPRSQGELSLAGHSARWRLGETRKGLLRTRKTLALLELEFHCDRANRSLSLSVSGEIPPGFLEEFLAAVPRWECHSR